MGWFDFLKKKKPAKREETEGDSAPPVAGGASDDFDDAGATPDPIQIDKDTQVTIRNQYNVAFFLDNVRANPFIFLHDKKTRAKYLKELINILESRPGANEYWSRPGFNLVATLTNVLDKADQFAVEKGMSRSPRKTLNLLTLAIFGGVMGFMLITTLIPDPVFQMISQVSMYIGLCVICIVPNFLKQYVLRKQASFQSQYLGQFREECQDELEIIHDAVQYFLEDFRQILLDNGLSMVPLKFSLMNSDYRNIKVLNQQKMRGTNEFVYQVRFLEDDEDPNEDDFGEMGVDIDEDDDDIDRDLDGDDYEDEYDPDPGEDANGEYGNDVDDQ